ncbi:YncE family protein [bacterium]|nr:YncE family protein [bacterium]
MAQKKTYYFIAILIFWAACKPDDIQPNPPQITGSEVIISSEGNFGWGEGTISLYNPESKTLEEEVYKRANSESPGNVLQSLTLLNDQYYLVMNNSKRIIVADENYVKKAVIEGFNSPRYLIPVSEEKAYVTDLYANKIWIVNTNSNVITGEIKMPGWTEKGIVINTTFWVCNRGTNKLYSIDIDTDLKMDSIELSLNPQGIVVDKDEKLWVLSQGDGMGEKSAIQCIDPVTSKLLWSKALDFNAIDLAYNSQNDQLIVLGNKIYIMPADTTGQLNTLYSAVFDTPYGIAYDQFNNEVYASDVLDYTQKSRIIRIDDEGTLLDEFYTGIITGGFYFQSR